MKRAPLFILLSLAVGALAGFALAPKYQRPALADEERLKSRALEYYKASRVLDSLEMARHYTAAYQIAQQDELRKEAEKNQALYDSLDYKKDLQVARDSIRTSDIESEIDGDWAVTRGSFRSMIDGQSIPQKLDELVWMRSAGEWWVYRLDPSELNSYGNPPDRFRDLLQQARQNSNTVRFEKGADQPPPREPADDASQGGSTDTPAPDSGGQ